MTKKLIYSKIYSLVHSSKVQISKYLQEEKQKNGGTSSQPYPKKINPKIIQSNGSKTNFNKMFFNKENPIIGFSQENLVSSFDNKNQ